MNLFILIWLPGSWKSTYLNNLETSDNLILSSDEIRKELWNDITEQKNSWLVFDILHKRLLIWIKNNISNIYIDATNINLKSRKFFTELKKNKKYKNINLIAIDFVLNLKTIIKQDSLREKFVWKKVIYKMLLRYIEPTIEEWFDKIIKINRTFDFSKKQLNAINQYLNVFSNKRSLIEKNEKMIFKKLLLEDNYLIKSFGFEQNSQYHQETLNEHLELILLEILKLKLSKNKMKLLLLINYFHDIWKIFTRKTRKERQLQIWRELISEDVEKNIWFVKNKNWDVIEIKNFFDYQFIWHEQVSYILYIREYKDNLIKHWIISIKESIIIENIIKYHLNFHQVNRENKTILNLWNILFSKGDEIFDLWLIFSNCDSKGRVIRKI